MLLLTTLQTHTPPSSCDDFIQFGIGPADDVGWDDASSDFGQKADLCVRIREICVNYPEGTSIIKELIQNADDAGARNFKLCLDLRQHGTSTVVGPGMAQYQGPAILAYNSARFQEADFQSIRRIGDSLKSE